MSYICDCCSKGKVQSVQSRHRKGVAGKQWARRAQKTLRVFSPNLQSATIDGVKVKLCTKCLKRLKVPRVTELRKVTGISKGEAKIAMITEATV